ncbi:MAG TPA: FliG C-terminal domain-containing protein [Spirochaetia bacterium]|nr:FliG C-terminal domain-containing protein [Spirochaetia bacterium]
MRDFRAFMTYGKFDDVVIQMALREIDAPTLAVALADQDETVQEIVLRNMSQRAARCLSEDIRQNASAPQGPDRESIQDAQRYFAGLVEWADRQYARTG